MQLKGGNGGMKARRLNRGDTVAVVSLSSGMLGEPFVSHQLELAKKRLEGYGFQVKFMPNALKGIDYIKAHPEKRARDLLDAFQDRETKAILCAIGGEDTYRLSPYLFESGELERAVRENPKLFLGFSDTTVNHLMLYRCGLNTFYGQALLPDLGELEREMLPYTQKYFEQLFIAGDIPEIVPSPVWYEERASFGPESLGIRRISHADGKGFELLQGSGRFGGRILGGCVESLADMLTGKRFPDEKQLVRQYGLFPSPQEWTGKLLLLETSEEKPEPAVLKEMLEAIKAAGVFAAVSGVLIGKPMDETYYDAYREVYLQAIDTPELSIVYNVNVGHAVPRCIVPFGVMAQVDAKANTIRITEPILDRE